MSKKLIAVAAAAALALTSLVGVAPASASTTVTYDGAASGQGLTAAAPIVINVPSQNVLRNAGGASATTSGSVIRVDLDSALTSNTIRVTATGSVKLLTTAQFSVTANRTASFGSQSLELTGSAAAGLAGFYAYTTSTEVGTILIEDAGNTIVRHIQGANTVDYAYNVDFTAATTADVSGSIKLTGSITDVFGNKIEGLTAAQALLSSGGTMTVTRFGAAGELSAVAADVWTESTTSKGTYTFSVLTTATAGAGVIGLNIDVLAVTDLPAPKNSALFQFTTASLADQVAILTATIANMRTKALSVTLKRWNDLVKRHRALGGSAKLKTR